MIDFDLHDFRFFLKSITFGKIDWVIHLKKKVDSATKKS